MPGAYFALLPLRSQLVLQRAGCASPAQARLALRAGRIQPGRDLAPRAYVELCRFLQLSPGGQHPA